MNSSAPWSTGSNRGRPFCVPRSVRTSTSHSLRTSTARQGRGDRLPRRDSFFVNTTVGLSFWHRRNATGIRQLSSHLPCLHPRLHLAKKPRRRTWDVASAIHCSSHPIFALQMFGLRPHPPEPFQSVSTPNLTSALHTDAHRGTPASFRNARRRGCQRARLQKGEFGPLEHCFGSVQGPHSEAGLGAGRAWLGERVKI